MVADLRIPGRFENEASQIQHSEHSRVVWHQAGGPTGVSSSAASFGCRLLSFLAVVPFSSMTMGTVTVEVISWF